MTLQLPQSTPSLAFRATSACGNMLKPARVTATQAGPPRRSHPGRPAAVSPEDASFGASTRIGARGRARAKTVVFACFTGTPHQVSLATAGRGAGSTLVSAMWRPTALVALAAFACVAAQVTAVSVPVQRTIRGRSRFDAT